MSLSKPKIKGTLKKNMSTRQDVHLWRLCLYHSLFEPQPRQNLNPRFPSFLLIALDLINYAYAILPPVSTDGSLVLKFDIFTPKSNVFRNPTANNP